MTKLDYDLFVIGAGSGGVRAARVSAGYGARVAIAEDYRVGGTCVIRGCVPKKLLVYAAHVREEIEDAAGYGWTIPPARFDWPALIAHKDREIARLEGIYRRLLAGSKVELIEGRARLVDPHAVEIGGRRISAERILIATGAEPVRLPGYDAGNSITSNEAFQLERLPERIAIVGGGYIAVEFAGLLAGLGAQVTQLYRGEKFLRGFDSDLRDGLAEAMRGSGIDLRFSTTARAIERTGPATRLQLSDGGVLEVDALFLCTGRRANVAGLDLDAAGVATTRGGAIPVDQAMTTNVPHIYALGDVTDQLNLTPVATAQGHALADTLFGNRPRSVSLANVPTAVFSNPPMASVGLTEEEAAARGPADIYLTRFTPMRHTISGRARRTMIKLVVDGASQAVLGAHMLGEDAPEIMQGIAVALVAGATKADFCALATRPCAEAMLMIPPALGLHRRQGGAHRVERAGEVDRDVGACLGQGVGDGEPDPRARAGDQRHPSAQRHVGTPCRVDSCRHVGPAPHGPQSAAQCGRAPSPALEPISHGCE